VRPCSSRTPQGLPSATKEFINDHETITKAVVAGGPVAVSDGVYEWLDDRLEVDRVAGDDRYETAAKLAVVGLEGDEDIGLAPSLSMYRFVVATGEDFADALHEEARMRLVSGDLWCLRRGASWPHRLNSSWRSMRIVSCTLTSPVGRSRYRARWQTISPPSCTSGSTRTDHTAG